MKDFFPHRMSKRDFPENLTPRQAADSIAIAKNILIVQL